MLWQLAAMSVFRTVMIFSTKTILLIASVDVSMDGKQRKVDLEIGFKLVVKLLNTGLVLLHEEGEERTNGISG